jgi:PPK2 family polyphosphate:nucleotide phosphotransferase
MIKGGDTMARKDKKNWEKLFRVTNGKGFSYSKFDPDATPGIADREEAAAILAKNTVRMNQLQERLYAAGAQSLLIVLQALDTGGKDGTIRAIFGPLNPQGVQVTSFKVPSAQELSHDYLWRVHQQVPPKGMIGIFNRSHYEDVLVVRVHQLVEEKVVKKRYAQINAFEEHLQENGVTILKFHLCISRDEQRERLQKRLDDPEKHWKFNTGDLAERAIWDKYVDAYEKMLRNCAPSSAPWHVIPANKKWYRNAVISQIVTDAMEKMNPQFPPAEEGLDSVVIPE